MREVVVEPDELERQYNPRVAVPDFQAYLDRMAEASAQAYAMLPCVRDVRYGPGPRQTVDIFPAGNSGAPAVVFVHGGFWRALSKDRSAGLAMSLVPRGVAAVLVGYDLCPAVTLDRIVEEIAEALTWARRGLGAHGIDPGRLHLAGSSAGAHLLAMALARSVADPSVLACVRSAWLASGIYELDPVREISVNREIGLDGAAAARNSPVRFPRRVAFPLFVAVGAAESAAWIAQSTEYAAANRAVGNDVRLTIVPGENHFSLGLARPNSALHRLLLDHVAAGA